MDHLDAALACAVMGFDVGVTLPEESWKSLEELKDKHPAYEKLAMLPTYGITNVFIETTKAKSDHPNLDATDHKRFLTSAERHQLLDTYEHVIRL